MLTSVRLEDEHIFRKAIELNLPIESYWYLTKIIKESEYVASIGKSVADVRALYTRIFQYSAPFALREEDRDWLYQKGRGSKTLD